MVTENNAEVLVHCIKKCTNKTLHVYQGCVVGPMM